MPSGLKARSSVRREPLFDQFIIFPAIILFASFVLGGGVYLFRNYVENRVTDLNENLRRIEGQFEAPLINELTRIAKEIEAAKLVLDAHVQNSRIFDFVEDFTHQNVYFNSFNFDGAETTLAGRAPSYTILAEQMRLFEESGVIPSLRISNIALGEDGDIGFNIVLNFDPSIFTYHPSSI